MPLIVYVDDDDDDFFLFKKAVNEISDHYSVLHANNPCHLFELINAIKPNFIFLDIDMPIMNGVDCLKKIRSLQKYDSIPIIIYSTCNDFLEVSYKNKANYYLVKPNSFVEMLTTIGPLLAYNWSEDSYPTKEKLSIN